MSAPRVLDFHAPGIGDLFDDLPLWSAPFLLDLLERVPLAPDLTAVDVGAGTGALSLELAQRCGPRSRIIAVDPWEEALDRLEKKRAGWGIQNVEIRRQDAVDLDLPPASVDVVVSNLGLNNFAEPEKVLEVCRRILKKPGALLFTTNLTGHMQEFYDVFETVLRETGHHERIAALQSHVDHRGTVESVAGLLEGSGFTVRHRSLSSFSFRFADGTALFGHVLIRIGFLEPWLELVPEASRDEVFGELEAALNRVARDRGDLSLTIPRALFEAVPSGDA